MITIEWPYSGIILLIIMIILWKIGHWTPNIEKEEVEE